MPVASSFSFLLDGPIVLWRLLYVFLDGACHMGMGKKGFDGDLAVICQAGRPASQSFSKIVVLSVF
jgi:hypothetical protein